MQRELLVELLLPLMEHRSGYQEQRCLGLTGHQQLTEDQPRLDGLAEPDLVSEKVGPRVGAHGAPGDRRLVRPRFDARRGKPDAGATVEGRRR